MSASAFMFLSHFHFFLMFAYDRMRLEFHNEERKRAKNNAMNAEHAEHVVLSERNGTG